MLKRRLQRALALQLLAKSNRLRKGGCALKRLSEDFRIRHGCGLLDQGVFRDRPKSRAAHLFYSRLTNRRLRRERSRKQEAVAPIDRASPAHAARLRLPWTSQFSHRALRFVCPSAGPARSIAPWRRHAAMGKGFVKIAGYLANPDAHATGGGKQT